MSFLEMIFSHFKRHLELYHNFSCIHLPISNWHQKLYFSCLHLPAFSYFKTGIRSYTLAAHICQRFPISNTIRSCTLTLAVHISQHFQWRAVRSCTIHVHVAVHAFQCFVCPCDFFCSCKWSLYICIYLHTVCIILHM